MNLDLLFGNTHTVQSLKSALKSGKFMHSVLMCGQKGTGVNFAAKCLALDFLHLKSNSDINVNGENIADVNDFLNENAYEKDNSNDNLFLNNALSTLSAEYIVIEGQGASGEIPVSAIRTARREIFNTSLSASGRVLHIKGAHKLNHHSANALLKVLEDPPDNVLFILTAPNVGSILPTLKSRCAVYNFSNVSINECTQYLQKRFSNIKGINKLAQSYSAIFNGNIGFCTDIFENEASKKMLDDAENILTFMLNFDEYSVLQTLCKYEKSSADAKQLFLILLMVCSYNLKQQIGTEKKQIIIKMCNKITHSVNLLSSNVNLKLVLTLFCTGITQ